MSFFSRLGGWFGRSGAIGDATGTQNPVPSASLVADLSNVGVDGALQISTVWACIDRRASTIASLPFFTYQTINGQRTLARSTRLYALLHESPNSRMTPFEFLRALVMNYDLRGNAYARIDRDNTGEAIAMWPMASDQVEVKVLDDGSMVYIYRIGSDVAILADTNVLHIKNLGNGTTGLAKLEFMRSTTDEVAKQNTSASKLFSTSGKPTGILMIDKVLSKEQRNALTKSFKGLAEGSTSRLQVLEANMKYQQISMSPEDQQLLETRKFSVEELCRWFDVPPVLVHHSNVTAWGTGIFEIKDGFYTLALAPLCKNIEQAFRKRVMTPKQRASMTCEFSMDAMMRASIKDRFEIYAKATQNGLKTRNECRQLENDPPLAGGDVLTAQSNLVPLPMLGTVVSNSSNTGSASATAQ
jgi:HK97 family phage portal protein